MGGSGAKSPVILVLDDDPGQARGLSDLLGAQGFETQAFSEPGAALERVRDRSPRLVLLDLRLPGVCGLDVLREMRRLPDPPEVIVITGYGSIPDAVEAIRRGAADFVEKPVTRERLLAAVERILGGRPQAEDGEEAGLLGDGTAMRRFRRLLRLAAVADPCTVLLHGESGTGKELAARTLHAWSRRREGPFVPLNCAALASGLLDAELFGYARGAFTGADPGGREGLFQAAHCGTLFLDEVAELAPDAQAKLLRALETGVVRPVGGTAAVPVDVRLVAATHRDLAEEARLGRFREDLFFRLHALRLDLPPLRDRRDDILPLARHFLDRARARFGRQARGFSPEAEALLLRHPWPGNVRELLNVVERAVVLGGGDLIGLPQLDVRDRLPSRAPAAPAPPERERILEALEAARGNVSRAARLLGVHRSTLYDRAARLGIGLRREDVPAWRS